VLHELAVDVARLERTIKELVQIVIIDNDSICFLKKERLCNELRIEFNINIQIKKNDYNIGADKNIHKCCVATPESTFTWVLGDDDHVVAGSIGYITNILLSNQDNLDLMILSGSGYAIHPKLLKNEYYDSYYDLAKTAVMFQPHFLIAHTLISCNIFRTGIYIESESSYYINSLKYRYGHFIGFSHMKGLVTGLLRTNNRVFLSSRHTIDTKQRESDVDFGEQIFEVYYFYFLWLLTEIGVRIDQIKCDQTMLWLNGGIRFRIFLLGRRANLRERFKLLLIRLFGAKIFYGIRRVLRGCQL
jgi:hypothetical protein